MQLPLLALPTAVLAASGILGAPQPSNSNSQRPSCGSLRPSPIPGVRYLDVQSREYTNATYPGAQAGTSVTLSFCEVNVTLTHGKAGDRVLVSTWLPHEADWNARFQGTGGGGYRAGTFGQALAPAVAQGYSAASTDAGIDANRPDGDFILRNATGDVNLDLLTNFAGRSLHEMTLLGKDFTRQFYGGKRRFYSYWNGCSTGGRQGMIEAQRYPTDYDGIMASAPAINWSQFSPAGSFPNNQRVQSGYDGPTCELVEMQRRLIDACDALDGARDGVIAALDRCQFDPHSIVGQRYTCAETGAELQFTQAAADLVDVTWNGGRDAQGRKAWYGFERGTNLTQATAEDPSFATYSQIWIRQAVKKDPQFDVTALSQDELSRVIYQSYAEWNDLIGTSDPDLRKAYQHGTKILTWHGTSDQAIPFSGTIDYYTRTTDFLRVKGVEIDDFYRLFSAPGVAHCRGGVGAAPDDPLQAVVDWVEQGRAPERLAATTQDARKKKEDLCRYPKMATWNAQGDVECKVTDFSRNFKPLPRPPKV
ncbi:uncharacterized protein PFL1_06151 [Pseudozyma flocculosa PF-1]|uniref:Carboxylic ester hydrolase n=2 Tax=Pseudozyma flocculosa TaxID=84751 RepID=A0A5C3F9V0_9BASI|nr:uncharacterized protein PFL1_06151 [Pseudozyma flocculosa PF-1]EPQ26216.1 hypothetical protein PFL1_06151 [Pseudozyma flocculosa PF-1]SPO40171.1 related to feruloyl esterase B precursor [Pseudozyma flocculosa]